MYFKKKSFLYLKINIPGNTQEKSGRLEKVFTDISNSVYFFYYALISFIINNMLLRVGFFATFNFLFQQNNALYLHARVSEILN